MSELYMQAVRYDRFGGPEVLKVELAPRPSPGPGEVLVRVIRAGVLPVDWKIRKGLFPMPVNFPNIPGSALSGVVDAIGEGVSGFKPGDAVFGRSGKGTYAEYVAAPAETIALLPEGLGFDIGATVTGGAATAWQAVVRNGGVQTGDRVLVHAAAGGVGLYAVQFAKWLGAEVIGTASSANVDFVRSLGADRVVDYGSEAFEHVASNVDFVLDTIGGDTLERSWSVLRPGGKLITIVGQPPVEKAEKLGMRTTGLSVSSGADLVNIGRLLADGTVKAFVQRTFAFNEVQEAHRLCETGHGRGRILLKVGQE